MYRSSLLLTGALLTSLSGCDTNKGPIKAGFGNAVQHNMSAHIVNPRTPNAGAQAPEMEGVRAFTAIDRYRRGEVKKLKINPTTKISGAKQ